MYINLGILPQYAYGYQLCSCSHILVPLFDWDRLFEKSKKKLAWCFNFKFLYVLSLNNSNFGDYVDHIYPIELEIKDMTDTDRSASYIDLHVEMYNEDRNIRTKLYNKRVYFNFPIVNFLFICKNIPAAPAYAVSISHLIRYSRVCGSYHDFLDRELLLTRKLLNQGFLVAKLKSSLPMFYGRYYDLSTYRISMLQMTTYFVLSS